MLKAVVYTSQTGFTEQYARMLAGKAGLGCYTVKEAKKRLNKEDEYIYMGWLSAGKIVGLSKAKRLSAPAAIAAVGISAPDLAYEEKLKKQNKLGETAFFYLQGGFAREKLRGIPKMMMNAAHSSLLKAAKAQKDPTPQQKKAAELLEYGGSCVTKEALIPLIGWAVAHKNKKV